MPRLTREAEKCFEEERFLLTPKSLSWIDGPLERASLAPVHGCVTSNASPDSRSRKMLRGGEIFVDTKKPFMDRVRFSERCLGATVLRLHEGLWGLGAAAFAEANPTREPRTLNFRPRIMGFRIAGRGAPMDPRGCQ